MEDEKKNKHAEIVNKIVSLLIGALGLYFIVMTLTSLRRILSDEEPLSHIFFLFCFAIPILLVGGYCVFAAYRIWSKISPENVRRMSFVSSVFMYFILAVKFSSVGEENVLLKSSLFMIAAGLFYWLSIKYVSRYFGLKESIDWDRREKTVRRFFGLLSFTICGSLMNVFMNLEQQISSLDKAPWWPFTVLFFSIVPAFLVYRLGVRIALRNKPRGIEEKDVSSIEQESEEEDD